MQIHAAAREWPQLARQALEEAIASAGSHHLPLVIHHTPAQHLRRR